MREKIKTGFSILIILILLPYVAMVFRTGNPAGSEAKTEEPGLEDFVAGILPGQMSVTYEEEALKAQAVIVRTNLLKKCLEFYGTADMDEAAKALRETELEEMGFVYYTPEKMEELWGYESWERYEAKVRSAAKSTAGEILALDGSPVELPYHAVSAGKTRDGQVLGEAYSYLEAVECPGDLEAADYLKVQAFSESLPEILSRDASGYVTEVRLGEEVLAGEEFRTRYGLNSSSFSFAESEEGIRITTKGLGHGLGMSQYQANLQAISGKTYLEILLYFYKNVECISFS